MLVRLKQPLNADSPILVTPSGIIILVRLEQALNAYCPILFPPVIITSFNDAGI